MGAKGFGGPVGRVPFPDQAVSILPVTPLANLQKVNHEL